MDIERLVNESGFIPTDHMDNWRSSLTGEQRQAMDDYFYKLWSDALYDETAMQMEAF